MVSTPIGGIRVDLQLNSAAFIRDIAKSTSAMSTGIQRTNKSLATLQNSVATINRAFLGFLTIRAAKQVANYTEQATKLAATIRGPLGIAARGFIEQAEKLSGSFKIGLAEGFIQTLQAGLANSGAGMRQLAAAGIIAGDLIGFAFTTIVRTFTEWIPAGIIASIQALNSLIASINGFASKFNALNESLNNSALGKLLGFGGTTIGNLPQLPTLVVPSFDFTNLVSGTTIANSYAAALQTTTEKQKQLNFAEQEFSMLVSANNALWESTRTPLEKYAEALDKIATAHASAELAARATAKAQQELASSYLDAASQVTGTLAQAFADNKAVQIANCLVNAAAAMVRALDLPFPLNWAQVAAVGALAATQIATIRSAQPGTGGNIKKGTGGGTAAAGAASTASGPKNARGGGGPTQTVTLQIIGDVFGPEHFRKIIEGINGAQRDGTMLLQVA